LFGEIIHLAVAAKKTLCLVYKLGDDYYRCEHKPLYNGNLGQQKGNIYLHGIGKYTIDGYKLSVQTMLASISSKHGAQKIAEAMRTSRTTGLHIENVRIREGGDGQITASFSENNFSNCESSFYVCVCV
jgi:hypothetical protein